MFSCFLLAILYSPFVSIVFLHMMPTPPSAKTGNMSHLHDLSLVYYIDEYALLGFPLWLLVLQFLPQPRYPPTLNLPIETKSSPPCTRWRFQLFLMFTLPGRWSNLTVFDIFQLGWFNHQLLLLAGDGHHLRVANGKNRTPQLFESRSSERWCWRTMEGERSSLVEIKAPWTPFKQWGCCCCCCCCCDCCCLLVVGCGLLVVSVRRVFFAPSTSMEPIHGISNRPQIIQFEFKKCVSGMVEGPTVFEFKTML